MLQGDVQFDANGTPLSLAAFEDDEEEDASGGDELEASAGGSNSWGRPSAAPTSRRPAAGAAGNHGSRHSGGGSPSGLEAENGQLRSRLKAVESVGAPCIYVPAQ